MDGNKTRRYVEFTYQFVFQHDRVAASVYTQM